MIKCPMCEFEVSSKMRHALSKNMCPSCGSPLMGDLHTRRLQSIKQKILEQDFGQKLDSDILFDLSLFILSEFFRSKPERSKIKEDDNNEDDDLRKIREEVEAEVLPRLDISEFSEESSESELDDPDFDESEWDGSSTIISKEVDLKVQKLKNAYKNSGVLNKNPGFSVRRVG